MTRSKQRHSDFLDTLYLSEARAEYLRICGKDPSVRPSPPKIAQKNIILASRCVTHIILEVLQGRHRHHHGLQNELPPGPITEFHPAWFILLFLQCLRRCAVLSANSSICSVSSSTVKHIAALNRRHSDR